MTNTEAFSPVSRLRGNCPPVSSRTHKYRSCWRQLLAAIETDLSAIALLRGRFLVTDLQVCCCFVCSQSAGRSTLHNAPRMLQNVRNAEHSSWRRQSVRGASGFSKRGPRPPQQGLQHGTSLPEQNKMTSQCGGST
jgi:hypothetical protein